VAGPVAANQLGWVGAEVGRQPWVVLRPLAHPDALSKAVKAGAVLGSIGMFALIYALLFAVWVYVLDDKIKHGPDETAPVPGRPPSKGWSTRRVAASPHGFSMTGSEGREADRKEG